MTSPESNRRPADDIPIETDLSLRHLVAELARIDLLLGHEVRRWQLAGQDAADAFRGLYVSDAQADALLARPLGTSWGHLAVPNRSETETYAHAESQAALQAKALAEAARRQGHTVRLEHLQRAFGLDRFEVDTLLVCLAPSLDLRYERLCGYLQDDVTRRRPSVDLVLNLLCEPGPKRLRWLARFTDGAPLFKYQILERETASGSANPPLLAQTLTPDETIVAWLLGNYYPQARLGACATLSQPRDKEADALLAGKAHQCCQLCRSVAGSSDPDEWPIVVFYGPDDASQRAAARMLAAQTKRSLLTVDLSVAIDSGLAPLAALHRALRDARLTGAIAFLTGWDACLGDEGGGAPPPQVLHELCTYPGLAIVAGRRPWQATGVSRERRLVWLEFPIPPYSQRRALWEHTLLSQTPEAGQTPRASESEIAALAGQFQLTTGKIRDAVASARDMAAQRDELPDSEHLFAAARSHSNPCLSSLARQIVPRYGWDDIILPDDQLALLREIVATVIERPQVLDEWGLGQKLVSSRGVTALFSGPPGTGKTMAAEILAAELRLDLYKIDLSTVVSKYIGETEKNLERIFNEAEQSNAILFFDEADALFGKRSEVRDSHDRYANIEISYLLQRMEMYDGVTILATNLRANLDEAFTRRLQFAVDFPFPEAPDRLRIWHTLFPPDVPHEPRLDFDLLAHRFQLAGGNIRNVLVSAAYLAASDGQIVTMEHLLHGIRRELQKMGRLINAEDLITDQG